MKTITFDVPDDFAAYGLAKGAAILLEADPAATPSNREKNIAFLQAELAPGYHKAKQSAVAVSISARETAEQAARDAVATETADRQAKRDTALAASQADMEAFA